MSLPESISEHSSPPPEDLAARAALAAFMQEAEEAVRLYEATKAATEREREEASRLREEAERQAEELLQKARAERERLIEETAQELDERTANLVERLNRARSNELMSLVRETQGEAVAKAEAAAMWQARAEMLAGELRGARETIRALSSGANAAPAALEGRRLHESSGPPAPSFAEWQRPGPNPDAAVDRAARSGDSAVPRGDGEPEATSPADAPPPTATDDIAERLRAAIAQTATIAPTGSESGARVGPASEPTPRTVRVLPPDRGSAATELVDAEDGSGLRGGDTPFRNSPKLSQAPVVSQLLWIANLLVRVLLIACVVGLAALVAPLALGYKVLPVIGGSMEPTIKLGSVIAVKPIAPADVQVGDIITFSDRNKPGVLVTHRVVSIDRGERTRPVIRTRGDANNVEDAWEVPTDQPIEKAVFWVPYAGYVVAYLASPQSKFVLAGVMGLLVVYQVLISGRASRRDSSGTLSPRPA